VKSIGMDATAQSAGREYGDGPQARTLFSFTVDAAPSDDDDTGRAATMMTMRTATIRKKIGLTRQRYTRRHGPSPEALQVRESRRPPEKEKERSQRREARRGKTGAAIQEGI
jgi:hypothetical protein